MMKLAKQFRTIFLVFLFAVNGNVLAKNTSDNMLQGRLNIVNGASSECVMHHFYTKSGWTQIEGEIGRNGIDGLYVKKKGNRIREVLVAESKWNKSKFGRSGKNKAIKQMSKEWVLRTLNKLSERLHDKVYLSIRRLVLSNQYRARLFRLKPTGKNSIQITIYSIKNKGLNVFEEVRDTQLKPININHPRNYFEKGLVTAYNNCRKIYLHKYLKKLSNTVISSLLKDNYIQVRDVKLLNRKSRTAAINQPVALSSLGSSKVASKQSVEVIGKVWVNSKSHVYHCFGTRWYGKTKRGEYLMETVAIQSGNRPARGSYCSSEGRKATETKNGRFMTESDAVRNGNRGAYSHKCN